MLQCCKCLKSSENVASSQIDDVDRLKVLQID